MNKESMKILSEIEDRFLEESENTAGSGKHVWKSRLAAALAVLLVIVGTVRFTDRNREPKPLNGTNSILAEVSASENSEVAMEEYAEIASAICNFNFRMLKTTVYDSGKNVLYSPANIYMAMSMLTQLANDETQDQLLEVLNFKDMESLASQAGLLYQGLNQSGEHSLLKTANSIWLANKYTYNTDLLNQLAIKQFASSYSGEMGSQDYDAMLQKWVNEHTNDFLKNQTGDLKFDPETVMSLVSTIYLKDSWIDVFSEKDNTMETFHAPSADKTVEMLNDHDTAPIYFGENFMAYQRFLFSSSIWFILPFEGVDVNDIRCSEELERFLTDPYSFEHRSAMVTIKIPKFDISSSSDLRKTMEDMGLTRIFDSSKAQFNEVVSEYESLYVSEIKHGARMKLDEEGIEAAAYTAMILNGMSLPTEFIDFILDRPFLFVLNSRSNVALFTGIVNDPTVR